MVMYSSTILLLIWLIDKSLSADLLPLRELNPNKGSIKVLRYEPSPEDFYKHFIHASVPVLIRPSNPSWSACLSGIQNLQQVHDHLQNVYGKAYKRPIWTDGWPLEIRLNFSSFWQGIATNKLYWDSIVPLNNSLLKHIPLPHSIRCGAYIKSLKPPNLLFTNQDATSVFHQDGSENFFFQLHGTKTWLIANYSYSKHAYADDYNLQPGLSPVNPEAVNLTKYPLMADIKFLEVKTQPGDMLYVPQYWWHHVTSKGAPNVGINLWLDMFNFSDLENSFEVEAYVKKFAELRQASPAAISCPLHHVTANAISENKHTMKSNQLDIIQMKKEMYPIFFSCDDGTFYAISSNAGELLWKYKTNNDAGSTPTLSQDEKMVYFAGEDAFVYGFDIISGEVKWKNKVNDAITAALRLSHDGELLYVVSLDRYAYAFNAKQGTLKWKQGPLDGELWASPFVTSSYLIICSMLESDDAEDKKTGSTVMRLDSKTGTVEWTYSTGSSVFGSPAVDVEDNKAFVASHDGYLYAIDTQTGKLHWKVHTGEYSDASPTYAPEEKRIFITTISGLVICIDVTKKSTPTIWAKNLIGNGDAISSPLMVKKHYVLYAAIGNQLYCLSMTDGEVIWNFTSADIFMSSPRVDSYGTLYIGSVDNKFYAIDIETGKLKWSINTNGPVVGSSAFPRRFLEPSSYGGLLQDNTNISPTM